MKKIILIFLFLIETSRGDGKLGDEGVFLIYDCNNIHYACVNEATFNECKEFRLVQTESTVGKFPCVPIKDFNTSEECSSSQYYYMYNPVTFDLCTTSKTVWLKMDSEAKKDISSINQSDADQLRGRVN